MATILQHDSPLREEEEPQPQPQQQQQQLLLPAFLVLDWLARPYPLGKLTLRLYLYEKESG